MEVMSLSPVDFRAGLDIEGDVGRRQTRNQQTRTDSDQPRPRIYNSNKLTYLVNIVVKAANARAHLE